VLPRALEDANRAEDVHLRVLDWTLNRDANIRLCGEVEDRLGPHRVEDVVERLPDVPDVQLRGGRDVVLGSVDQRIDDGDLGILRDQRVHDVGADEPGASGDDRPHDRILRTAIGWSGCS